MPRKYKVKEFILLVLLTSNFTFVSQDSVSAASCSTIKKGVKIIGSQINFSSEKSALRMADAYRLVLENPTCFSRKEFGEMKVAAKELIRTCRDSKSGLAELMGEKVWRTFCKGFIPLERYIK